MFSLIILFLHIFTLFNAKQHKLYYITFAHFRQVSFFRFEKIQPSWVLLKLTGVDKALLNQTNIS